MDNVIGTKNSVHFAWKNLYVHKKIVCMESLYVWLLGTQKIHKRVCQDKIRHVISEPGLGWNSSYFGSS